MDAQKQIQALQDQIAKLQSSLSDLQNAFYKNNFTSSQTFNKDSIFNTRLRVPIYSSAPSVSEVGDLISVTGVLYICTVAGGTFQKVGSQ